MGYVKDFFTNLKNAEGRVGAKLRTTAKNRVRALPRGCCGNYGEPGC
ncbi:MAG TPA: hypothetical protein VM841_02945 [Actinomycetota bacterium]|nr:hypothetical protein [Actinomycetota bacterium]